MEPMSLLNPALHATNGIHPPPLFTPSNLGDLPLKEIPPNPTQSATNSPQLSTPPYFSNLSPKETPRKQKINSNRYDADADGFQEKKVRHIWAQSILDHLRYDDGTIKDFMATYVPSDAPPYRLPDIASLLEVPATKGQESKMYGPLVGTQVMVLY